jgi:transcriptional regulator with XRE-family HTH domain
VPDRASKLQKTFGEAVRSERLARKLTQEKLAEKADLSLNFIGIVERGEQMASLDSIVRLAEALKMSGGELLSRAKL